jgi:hypothetical protein
MDAKARVQQTEFDLSTVRRRGSQRSILTRFPILHFRWRTGLTLLPTLLCAFVSLWSLRPARLHACSFLRPREAYVRLP